MSERQTDGPVPSTDRRTSDCCSVGRSLADEELAADVQTLATLGNDTRYEALRRIAAADEAVCVCELEPTLGVSQGAVSQALSRLFSAGLVDRRKEGRWRYYSATPRADRLLRVLDETRGLDDD
ncbi:ArsR/SmtB family transcription factor [Natrinema salaciae]|uniref:Transcriptional regulator, ArsR family n=1 Tax=Natrinema salaciae TaxID=1186196 RepID=A0A1H9RDM9_9EURY|nr:metalloregulator ArsR/SmtB family transcription factor [Natrinema salaciae]SER71001.1 transcriptional regulator, ArsR family [Natrinema salaciae]